MNTTINGLHLSGTPLIFIQGMYNGAASGSTISNIVATGSRNDAVGIVINDGANFLIKGNIFPIAIGLIELRLLVLFDEYGHFCAE